MELDDYKLTYLKNGIRTTGSTGVTEITYSEYINKVNYSENQTAVKSEQAGVQFAYFPVGTAERVTKTTTGALRTGIAIDLDHVYCKSLGDTQESHMKAYDKVVEVLKPNLCSEICILIQSFSYNPKLVIAFGAIGDVYYGNMFAYISDLLDDEKLSDINIGDEHGRIDSSCENLTQIQFLGRHAECIGNLTLSEFIDKAFSYKSTNSSKTSNKAVLKPTTRIVGKSKQNSNLEQTNSIQSKYEAKTYDCSHDTALDEIDFQSLNLHKNGVTVDGKVGHALRIEIGKFINRVRFKTLLPETDVDMLLSTLDDETRDDIRNVNYEDRVSNNVWKFGCEWVKNVLNVSLANDAEFTTLDDFKFDEKLSIDTEGHLKYDEFERLIVTHDKLYIYASTGTGKTTAAAKFLNNHKDSIVVVPENVNVMAYCGKHVWTGRSKDETSTVKEFLNAGTQVVSIEWLKNRPLILKYISINFQIIADETQTFTTDNVFRNVCIELFKTAKRVTCVSATPQIYTLQPDGLFENYYKVGIDTKITDFRLVKLTVDKNESGKQYTRRDQLIESAKYLYGKYKDAKFIILDNGLSKQDKTLVANKLSELSGNEIEYTESGNQFDSEFSKAVRAPKKFGDEIIQKVYTDIPKLTFASSFATAGLDIYSETGNKNDIVVLYGDWNNFTPLTIVQAGGRHRNSELQSVWEIQTSDYNCIHSDDENLYINEEAKNEIKFNDKRNFKSVRNETLSIYKHVIYESETVPVTNTIEKAKKQCGNNFEMFDYFVYL